MTKRALPFAPGVPEVHLEALQPFQTEDDHHVSLSMNSVKTYHSLLYLLPPFNSPPPPLSGGCSASQGNRHGESPRFFIAQYSTIHGFVRTGLRGVPLLVVTRTPGRERRTVSTPQLHPLHGENRKNGIHRPAVGQEIWFAPSGSSR
jgi:hypothetical protein